MIDLHTHILSGLDDGARTIRDSLRMCVIGYRDGIRTIVATPHTLDGVYQNDRSTILAKVRELNAALVKVGLQDPQSGSGIPKSSIHSPNDEIHNPKGLCPQSKIQNPHSQIEDPRSGIGNPESSPPNPESHIRILPGADIHLCEQTLRQLDSGNVTTIGDRGKCLLLEFSFHGIPHGADEILFRLTTGGIIPIITHPERNLQIGQNPTRYYEMIRRGCLGQVTAMSLTGGFGPGVRRVAEYLLTKRLVHLIASDAHSTDGRPPVLSR